MSYKDDLDLVNYGLQEVKDQYKIYLEGFDDIKKKNQILLLICSLIITLPLSSTYIINGIMEYRLFLGFFISGVICLIATIVLLITSMKDTPIEIPYSEDIIKSIGKYKPINVKKAIMKTYSRDLNVIIKRIEAKRKYVRYSEKLIIVGIILVVGTIISVLLIG